VSGIKVRWQKWLQESEKELTFPDSWDVSVAALRDALDTEEDGITA